MQEARPLLVHPAPVTPTVTQEQHSLRFDFFFTIDIRPGIAADTGPSCLSRLTQIQPVSVNPDPALHARAATHDRFQAASVQQKASAARAAATPLQAATTIIVPFDCGSSDVISQTLDVSIFLQQLILALQS
ncbi:hypothetical protein E4U22_001987 [Claviceps purpurea]|nr:hypothetical protein E4U11_003271 [Claviceps purpurea]KAG6164921.1 hypothetical protein E4U51_004724 [Claviceps purpurea]KAG6182662.1 hypothetical protein E4U27_001679 [Claviceps purpurea]KAG6305487.1 hypothetical protein E4U45_000187 [Claviceps purpurea]KAG6321362.1 hypothetical protein E4U22_001987 [Claviceps purpurea]